MLSLVLCVMLLPWETGCLWRGEDHHGEVSTSKLGLGNDGCGI